MVAKYARRKALKEAEAYEGLQELPKNASQLECNRCKLTGSQRVYASIRNFSCDIP